MNPPPPPQPSDPSPPALLDDLIIEILIRLPPDEPEHLFHASLVCKLWNHLLSGRAFLRRYGEFRRAPPFLGFFHNRFGLACFVPTTSFRLPDSDLANCSVLDCRHGRVLLQDCSSRDLLQIWDPMTGEKQHVRLPSIPTTTSFYKAAVFCATPDCDHLSCHGGPFLVAFVTTDPQDGAPAQACLYSSETGVWSAPSYLQLDYYVDTLPPVQVGDTLYFTCESRDMILCYDLGGDRDLSAIDVPDIYQDGIALMLMEDGALGFAGLHTVAIHLWSLKSPERVAAWEKQRVINLEMLPHCDLRAPMYYLLGIAQDCISDNIFVETDAGVFMIELKSERAVKVCERGCLYVIFPYIGFCTPGHARRLPVAATTQCSAIEPLIESTQQVVLADCQLQQRPNVLLLSCSLRGPNKVAKETLADILVCSDRH
ncbi:uncharacterized protein LOC100831669 isoform X2 [Brachypodium distachyon]|uniref:uncharacterized protein LOC100831669 isoform X2 n=1 Tax=Brachypodium distachyon TaxID=15368 RepID=UPI00071C55C4|nr:uncharacterized protein LOC100831669 isoform X2 [Brachypodium distachyon]|eukprot:XP_014752338.1 uncharacterized protein LOC100831669 isoform X2 [Brachypodium distachyon]